MYNTRYTLITGVFNVIKPFVIKRDTRKMIIVDAKRLDMDNVAAVIKY